MPLQTQSSPISHARAAEGTEAIIARKQEAVTASTSNAKNSSDALEATRLQNKQLARLLEILEAGPAMDNAAQDPLQEQLVQIGLWMQTLNERQNKIEGQLEHLITIFEQAAQQ